MGWGWERMESIQTALAHNLQSLVHSQDASLDMFPTIAIWIGAGSVEALDTTYLAEGVLGTMSVKGVGGEVISALDRKKMPEHTRECFWSA